MQSNERPFVGRIYTIILDDLHTAASRAPRVKAAARRFIERHMAANDLMAIVHTAGRDDASQDFTSSKRLLLAAVDRFMGLKLESATMARNEEFFRGAGAGGAAIGDPFDSRTRLQRAIDHAGAQDELQNGWAGSAAVAKRFSSSAKGLTTTSPIRSTTVRRQPILDEMRGAIAAATRSNVSIYTVDPRGLSAGGRRRHRERASSEISFRRRIRATLETPSQPQTRPGIGTGNLRTELQLSQDSLRTLADETNGFAAVSSNDFASAFERIVSDNSSYYVLAYYPPSNRRDGKFHRIEVRTSRPGSESARSPGLCRAEGKSTDAAAVMNNGGASPVVLRALNSPLPTNGLTMQMFAAPFKGTAPNASVVMGIELRGRDLTLDGGKRVELSYVAINASGQTRGDTDFFTLTLPPDIKAHVEQTGLRILRRFDLPPGRYQLRVAAHDIAGARVGSLNYDLEVPDYGKLPLSMSGLLLTSRAGTTIRTARPDALLQRAMPAPPVALRVFPERR